LHPTAPGNYPHQRPKSENHHRGESPAHEEYNDEYMMTGANIAQNFWVTEAFQKHMVHPNNTPSQMQMTDDATISVKLQK
jgi:hypothetical protein